MIEVELLVVPGSFLLPTATTGGMSSSFTALPLFNCRSREKFKVHDFNIYVRSS
jgi:hypothetical protein